MSRVLRAFGERPATARVGEVQRASGLSAQRFIRVFRETVGLAPKGYLRVLRLRSLLERVAGQPRIDWALAAAEAGYADQAHLTNEFRALTGLTPARWRPVAPDQPTHVALTGLQEKSARQPAPHAAR